MKQVDLHSERSRSATIMLGRDTFPVAQFDAPDEQAAAIFCVEVIESVLLRNWRTTDLMGETLLLDSSFGRVEDIAFGCD